MRLRVECYSGYKVDERPVRFQLNTNDYFVEEVLDQWYGPDDAYFKVRADDGNLYILRRETSVPEGEWTLESFRKDKREITRASRPGASHCKRPAKRTSRHAPTPGIIGE